MLSYRYQRSFRKRGLTLNESIFKEVLAEKQNMKSLVECPSVEIPPEATVSTPVLSTPRSRTIKRRKRAFYSRATSNYHNKAKECKLISNKMQKKLEEVKSESCSVEELLNVKVQLQMINQFFICSICKGYYHNATTITECLHTFCKGCLVKHLLYSLHCPKCHILIHPTDPLVNIRHDSTLQDLLYKIMPSVEQEELKRERLFLCEGSNQTTPLPPPTTNTMTVTSTYPPSTPTTNGNKRKRTTRQLQHKNSELGNNIPSNNNSNQSNDNIHISPNRPVSNGISHREEDLKANGDDEVIGIVLNFVGYAKGASPKKEIATPMPPHKFISLPCTTTIRSLQSYLHRAMTLSPHLQVCMFKNQYLLNECLTIQCICKLFSSCDDISMICEQEPMELSFAIIPPNINHFTCFSSSDDDDINDNNFDTSDRNINDDNDDNDYTHNGKRRRKRQNNSMKVYGGGDFYSYDDDDDDDDDVIDDFNDEDGACLWMDDDDDYQIGDDL